jgi:hypothetical protein
LHRQCQNGKRGQQPAGLCGYICNNDNIDKHAAQFINFFVIVKPFG